MSMDSELVILKKEVSALEKRYQWMQIDRQQYVRESKRLRNRIEMIEGSTAAPPPDRNKIVREALNRIIQATAPSPRDLHAMWQFANQGKPIFIKGNRHTSLSLDEPEEYPAPPPLPTETTFGEIVAFRIWRVKGNRLISAYTDHKWLPGATLQAHCKVEDRDQQGMPEKTGIHGWKSVFEVASYGEHMLTNGGYNMATDQFELSDIVIGRVKLWGDVVEHERGYRAEFGKIVSLDDCQSLRLPGPNDYRPVLGGKPHWNGELLAKLQAIYFPKADAK